MLVTTCTLRRSIVAMCLALGSTVHADDGLRSGFEVHGAGQLDGVVTGIAGDALARVDVHVAAAKGKRVVKTDARGRFHITLDGGAAFVYVHATAHVSATLSTATRVDGNEVIELHDMMPPAVMPIPKSSTRTIPPYSDKAIDADAWTRAWLVLEVSEAGTVTRLKLIDDPGYDLRDTAIRAAFALRFEPARDRSRQPVRAWMLWTYEWPSRRWMREHDAPSVRLPSDVEAVPCRGSGPTHTTYRDCRMPDMSNAVTQPWIEPRGR